MAKFIDTVTDPDRADRLASRSRVAARSAGSRTPSPAGPADLNRWYASSDDRQRGRARAWLAEEGYRPLPPP